LAKPNYTVGNGEVHEGDLVCMSLWVLKGH